MSISHPQFESLVRSHHAAVYRTASRLLPPADAEDVTQQVFAHVFEGKTPLGDDPGLTLRWLAGRLALNTLRGARSRRRNEERRAMQTPPSTTDDGYRSDERAALRRALDDLPPDLRTAVVLRYQEDLSFGAIARALSCSLSTAHDRVQRAIARLQQVLVRGGFVALSQRVHEALPVLDGPASVPPGLEPSLLELARLPAAAPAVASTAASAWPVAALALVGLAAAVIVGTRAGSGTESSAAAPVRLAPASAPAAAPTTAELQDPVPGASPARDIRAPVPAVAAAQEPTDADARIFGNVFDAADGQPLPASIRAVSLRRSTKGRPFERRTDADASGRFSLTVPVEPPGPEIWSVLVQQPDYVPFHTTLTLAVDGSAEVKAPLRRWATDVAGDWRMQIAVQDEAGQPVPGAIVEVRRRRSADPTFGKHAQEASGKTDAAGRVELRGDHHGEKLVRVSVRGKDLAPVVRELAVTDAGPQDLAVTLPEGLALTGVVRTAAAHEPVPRLGLNALQRGEQVGWASTNPDGTFTIGGLAAEPVTLMAHDETWSGFALEGVQPDARGLELLVKRRDDPRDHGLHKGEIHGRAVDAATDEGVDLSVWATSAVWIRTGEGVTPSLLDGVLHPRPVQRAMFGAPPPPSPEFHITGVEAGRYVVVVRHKGYAPAISEPFDLAEDALVTGIELQLHRGGTVQGRVVDAAGEPVAKATVYLTTSAQAAVDVRETAQALAGGDQYPRHRYPETDADGRFTLTHVPAGVTLHLVAAHGSAGTAATEPFVAREGGEQSFALTLR